MDWAANLVSQVTLRQAADTLGCRVKTVRNILSDQRHLFAAPSYRQGEFGPVRELTSLELDRLRGLLAAKRADWPRGASSHSPARTPPCVPT